MQLLGCVSVWEECCWRCLLALVSHSLTLWCFTAQELLSHPDSLAPVIAKISEQFPQWDSLGERQPQELKCSCVPPFIPVRGCAL